MTPLDVLHFFLYIWPPYVANGSAVLAGRLKWKHPIDLGRNFRDGRRIFGDGKTFEGFFIGVGAGTAVGWLPNVIHPLLTPIDAFVLSTAAMLGDLLGAFIKRRLCMPRGHPAFPLDQLDFILTAFLIVSFYREIPLWVILAAALVTPAIHRVTNYVAYLLRLKREPW